MIALAVDGGNSKTDVALFGVDGALLGHARGPLSSPHHLGVEAAVELLQRLAEEAGLNGQRADLAQVLLAGVDFPDEEAALLAALDAGGWAATNHVGNDTFAVLRAGTERGWGIAVTCGAGINGLGVAPDGRQVRFPSLGPTTGDWGGGYDVGLAGLWAAARSEDGRGPKTSLEHLVPAYFELETPLAVAHAIHTGALDERRLVELAPVVMRAADDDAAAAEIVDRQAAEIVALVRAAATRLGLTDSSAEVLVGGGMMRFGSARLERGIEDGVREIGPELVFRRQSSPPIVGAALLALDELGAGPEAQNRIRAELGAAIDRLEGRRDG